MKQPIHKNLALAFIVSVLAPLSAHAAIDVTGLPSFRVLSTQQTLQTPSNLTIKSGRDTTLKGAQASADKIIADIGGNLNLESEQDASNYRGRNRNIGGNISISYGNSWSVGANYSQAKSDSDYRAVNEQTGLFAGKGGYDLYVSKNTDLKGAVIASKAEESKNKLSTETLTYSNVDNKAEYETSTYGAGIQVGSSKGKTSVGFTPIIAAPMDGDANNTSHAAISDGTIEVRSDKNKDLASLSRDTDNSHKTLGKIFDQKKIAEQQETAKVFGEVAFQLVGGNSLALFTPQPLRPAEGTAYPLHPRIPKAGNHHAAIVCSVGFNFSLNSYTAPPAPWRYRLCGGCAEIPVDGLPAFWRSAQA
jgi:hypothetical protein